MREAVWAKIKSQMQKVDGEAWVGRLSNGDGLGRKTDLCL